MSKMKPVNSDVFVTEEIVPRVGRQDIEFLRKGIPASSCGRVRLCSHKLNEDRLHEMFISFDGSNYVRPSWHVQKDESLHVLEGVADYFFFDPQGRVMDTVPLGTFRSGHPFYCRIPAGVEHALLIRSEGLEIHEATVGPFKREDTVFSPWSPAENNTPGVSRFLDSLRRQLRIDRPLLKMKRTAQDVFVPEEHIVSVGPKEMDILKNAVHGTDRKRVRLCIHKNIENTLHEMFVVYMKMAYLKPKKHIGRDESLHILEGEADVFFFDDVGNITDAIPLGDYHSCRPFCVRIPASMYHTVIIRSEMLAVHEATLGPFRREDTVSAPWAPQELDTPEIARFMSRLRGVAESCAN